MQSCLACTNVISLSDLQFVKEKLTDGNQSLAARGIEKMLLSSACRLSYLCIRPLNGRYFVYALPCQFKTPLPSLNPLAMARASESSAHQRQPSDSYTLQRPAFACITACHSSGETAALLVPGMPLPLEGLVWGPVESGFSSGGTMPMVMLGGGALVISPGGHLLRLLKHTNLQYVSAKMRGVLAASLSLGLG